MSDHENSEIEDLDDVDAAGEISTDPDPENEETESTESVEPGAAVTSPVSPAAPLAKVAQPGLIQGLATGLANGTTILLAITRMSDDELLVTIQPPAGDKTLAAAALPMQVSGPANEIDAELLESLAHYVPAREFVASAAKEIAERTAAAAQHAKEEAEKKRTAAAASKPASKTETLLVTVKPPTAKLRVTNAQGAEQKVEAGKRVMLPTGRYNIAVSLEGFVEHTTSVNLAKSEKLDIELKEAEPSLLAGL